MNEEFRLWLKEENFKVVAFYPYTSIVQNRILSTNHNYEVKHQNLIQNFATKVKEMAQNLGCSWDNKVVVELAYKIDPSRDFHFKSSNIFVGYYDGQWSIGLGMYQPDNYTSKYNQYFE